MFFTLDLSMFLRFSVTTRVFTLKKYPLTPSLAQVIFESRGLLYNQELATKSCKAVSVNTDKPHVNQPNESGRATMLGKSIMNPL